MTSSKLVFYSYDEIFNLSRLLIRLTFKYTRRHRAPASRTGQLDVQLYEF